MNRETLKECIADAKTIRETAIASAKAALEEAFTPQLTAMFAEKLNELEKEEEDVKESEMNETYGMEEEGLEETFNLDELLAELEMEEEGYSMEEEGMKEESLEEDIMLEEMSDEEIEELVMKTIEDMIASGKLMAGEEAEEEGEEDMEDIEDMGGEETEEEEEVEEIDEEINIDELLAETDSLEEETVNEDLIATLGAIEQAIATADAGNIAAALVGVGLAAPLANALAKKLAKMKKSMEEAKDDDKEDKVTTVKPTGVTTVKPTGSSATAHQLEEMDETINELRKELNEVNLLNAKLLYTNKIFKAKNLTESEKIKVLNTFDKAETVKEVKLVFETLTESFRTTSTKNPIKESLGSASKTIAPAAPKQPIIEVNDAFARMQKLAGLKK